MDLFLSDRAGAKSHVAVLLDRVTQSRPGALQREALEGML